MCHGSMTHLQFFLPNYYLQYFIKLFHNLSANSGGQVVSSAPTARAQSCAPMFWFFLKDFFFLLLHLKKTFFQMESYFKIGDKRDKR